MKRIAYALLVLLPVFILLVSCRLVVFDNQLYSKEFVKYNAYDELGRENVEKNSELLIGYLKGENGLDPSFFNQKEKLHMIDVKNIVDRAITLLYIVILTLMVVISYLIYKRDYTSLYKALLLGSCVTLLVLLFLAFIISTNFDKLFINFHLLSFRNDLWQLNPATDKLIVMFPEGFFYDLSIRIAMIAAIMSIAIGSLSYMLYRGKRINMGST